MNAEQQRRDQDIEDSLFNAEPPIANTSVAHVNNPEWQRIFNDVAAEQEYAATHPDEFIAAIERGDDYFCGYNLQASRHHRYIQRPEFSPVPTRADAESYMRAVQGQDDGADELEVEDR